ncbi:hypothetical protein M758_3G243600 [Ceratodon purpureus]|uniref:Secreted protein n=1 Tax=Ceratodon purpureus TaxID=3225 RepID=A0A8T0IPG3_CERPU|nr:hypothetical protein KC19_3G243500 [Ceratodon purpureus]KAG0624370.1 hypothetical protein M758_3G243600 [Ceratodon purpureus]
MYSKKCPVVLILLLPTTSISVCTCHSERPLLRHTIFLCESTSKSLQLKTLECFSQASCTDCRSSQNSYKMTIGRI